MTKDAERAVLERLDGLYEIVLIPYSNSPYPKIETLDGREGELRKVSDMNILYYTEYELEKVTLFT